MDEQFSGEECFSASSSVQGVLCQQRGQPQAVQGELPQRHSDHDLSGVVVSAWNYAISGAIIVQLQVQPVRYPVPPTREDRSANANCDGWALGKPAGDGLLMPGLLKCPLLGQTAGPFHTVCGPDFARKRWHQRDREPYWRTAESQPTFGLHPARGMPPPGRDSGSVVLVRSKKGLAAAANDAIVPAGKDRRRRRCLPRFPRSAAVVPG